MTLRKYAWMMIGLAWAAAAGCAQSGALPPATATDAAPLPVKVVVVTMFERGADEGDAPGEFQFWKERRDLDRRIPLPQGHHALYYNPETQILGMVPGVGTANAAATTMAVGLDPRFDFSQAYWLVAGIAGIDPEDASIGSAAWSAYLVDGDLGHEIDVREIPEDWPFGYFARRTQRPFDTQEFYIRIDSLWPEEYYVFGELEGYSEVGQQLGEEEWTITAFDTEISSETASTNRATARFSFGFEAKRHISFYVIRILLPILIILSVSWVTFFLKDYSKRVDVAAGNLLLFIAFNFTISDSLPRVPTVI